MPFGLTIGTERAAALQQSIQDELTRRGYSPDADPVMAEYITIMVINNKTAVQITSELEDLIGADFGVDASFTDWLFEEAAKGAAGPDIVPQSPPIKADASDPGPSRDPPPHISNDSSRKVVSAPRSGVYQHAISQAFPPPTSQKRTASARSPSPSHPNKSRRTDLPTGPRAMLRDGPSNSNTNPQPNTRSLLDRVGGPANASGRSNGSAGFGRDEIQARIDNIVNGSPDPNMMMAGFPGMGGMDMNVMAAANMANPIMLQEMMMNQMALMAQMASSMGIINPNTGQFGGQGFPMQGGMPGDMGMFQNGTNNGFHGHQMGGNMNNSGMNGSARGRGTGRGGRGVGRGRGGAVNGASTHSSVAQEAAVPPSSESTAPEPPVIATPAPINPALVAGPPAATPVAVGTPAPPQRLAYAIPERPQSPTLCKFGLKCTNAHCRYSHPSPVATAESGVVLSNDPCEKGRDCKDKDCIRAHVSPAVLNPQTETSVPTPSVTSSHHHPSTLTPCRFGLACTRPGCTFSHPPRGTQSTHGATQCRFGAGCTRAACHFQHPEGRVLPTTFHRGISTTGPIVNVQTPETGSMGGPSPHRSVTFNNPAGSGAGVKEKLEKQMKEIQDKKNEVERAVREAEAAAGKKDDSKPVAITV